jgi:hypothetical protein
VVGLSTGLGGEEARVGGSVLCGPVDVSCVYGWEGLVAGTLGEHGEPDGHHVRKGLSPADDLSGAFGFGCEVGNWDETCGAPEIIGLKSDSAARLDCEQAVSDGFGFDGFEHCEAVVSALGVHVDGSVGDAAELWLPGEMRAGEYITGGIAVFVADSDVSAFKAFFDSEAWEESEGVAEFFKGVLNKRKVVRRSKPDLIRFRIEASDMRSLGDLDCTITQEGVAAVSCHNDGSLGFWSVTEKKSAAFRGC